MSWGTFKLLVFVALLVACALTDMTWWIPAAFFAGAIEVTVNR